MAVIKCKMCGGDLLLTEGSTVAECEYCGSVQTVPTADNEKKLTLFARANRLRAANEFDKAAGVYESIVADFPEEAEAYWGLVLCKFGIEYVDDPATGKKVPTCHRSGFDSVMKDSDFEQACENADPTARRVYREEAKQIEEIRRRIIEVSGREEPYDIFICYKETDAGGKRTVDSVIAQNVYDKLTESGYRVFFARITLEDKLGLEYEPYIFAALNSAKVMLVFGTDYEHFNAVWVKNEWSRFLKLMAADKTKYLIPCYKDIDAYDMPEEFAHLQAQDMGKVGAEQDLIRGIKKLLPKEEPKQEQKVVQGGPDAGSLLKRAGIFLSEGEWDSAAEYFNKVLDIDPENSEAYFGLMLAAAKCDKNTFEKDYIAGKVQPGKEFARAKRFADTETAEWFNTLEAKKAEAEAERRRDEEERRKAEEEEKRRLLEEVKVRLESERQKIAPVQKLISAGQYHTACVRTDGTVVATKDTGRYDYGQREVSGWKDIVAVSAGYYHTVGLKADGTVVATKYTGDQEDYRGQCEVSGWKDIVAVSAGDYHTVGLKTDGTVVAVGKTYGNPREITGWKDIVAVSAGVFHTVVLKADGTVVAVGSNSDGECEVSGWKDIVAVSAGYYHTVGLKSDGTVVATKYLGKHYSSQCEVSGWKDIVAVSAGYGHTVGLKADGTVVAVGDDSDSRCEVADWKDIVAVSAGSDHTVGLKADGTVVAAGDNYTGQCEVADWKLFNSIDTIQKERIEAKERAERERMEAAERAERERREAEERARQEQEQKRQQLLSALAAAQQKKAAAEAELPTLKGLFAGKRRKELEAEIASAQRTIAEAEAQLNRLG